MIEILNLSKGIASPSFETVTLDFLIAKQEKEVNDAMRYYRNNKRTIPAGHWMYRLCKLLDWGHEPTFSTYYFRAKDEEETICRNMGIYTAINKGHALDLNMGTDGFCVGFNNTHVDSGSYVSLGSKWETLEPVKVVHRPGVKGSLLLPDDPKQDYDGYCAISVDIPLLAIMYLGFKKQESTKPITERMGTGDFISGYLLPNMMRSQFTCIIQNMFLSTKTYDDDDHAPVFTNGNQLKNIIHESDKLITEYMGRERTNLEMASSLPQVWSEPFFKTVSFENIATVNNFWGSLVSGVSPTMAIVGIIDSKDGGSNKVMFNRINRRVKSERTFNKLPEGADAYFRSTYDDVRLAL